MTNRRDVATMIVRLSLSIAIVAFAGALGRGAQIHPRDAGWVAPADAAKRPNPLTGRTDAAAGGRRLFHERCAACHGDDASGTTRGADLTGVDVQGQSDGALFWKISQGNTRRGMPTFSFLPEMQRWQLVLHLRAHRTSSSESSERSMSRASGGGVHRR